MLKQRILRQFYSTSSRTTNNQTPAQYCFNLVRQYDYENFLTLLLLKNRSRANAFAIRSFNVEISRIPEIISEKSIGLMRMKFWEDAIDNCYMKDIKRIPQQPVTLELFKAINDSKLTKSYFKNLINSRRDNLNVRIFNSLEDMEKYSEKSVSSVYYLLLEGCGVKNIHADHAVSHLGKAQGILQQLRSLIYAERLKFIGLPQGLLIKHKISEEDIIRGKTSDNLNECVYEVATRAHQHLKKSQNLRVNIPENCCKILLPAVIVDSYLKRLEKVHYNIFHPSLRYRSWKLLPQLWYHNFRNKY